MKVSEVMTTGKLITARPDDALPLAAQMMVWGNARHLPVVRDGQVVGVVSQRDLLGRERLETPATATVQDVMHSPAITVDADAPLRSAVSLMFESKLGCLPVLSPGTATLTGILTTTDLLRHLLGTAIVRPNDELARPVRAVMRPVPQGISAATELFDSAGLIVRADAPLASAVAELLTQSVGVLPVVSDDGTLVGTLSYTDLIKALRERDHP